jgi:dTDP-4-dehydrorhamnose 3,5-epimerase
MAIISFAWSGKGPRDMGGVIELGTEATRVFQWQSYASAPMIHDVQFVPLTRHVDEGGSMTELGRLLHGCHAGLAGFEVRQVNYSEIEGGIVRAYHVHMRQTDVWFVPPTDRILVVLLDIRRGSPTEGAHMRFVLGGGASRLVRIPPGVAHGARNVTTTTGHIIYFTDVHFSADPAECDEGRLPWDYAGADIWEAGRG